MHGKQIELERDTGLPPGSIVEVSIEPESLTLAEKRRLLDSVHGAWADDSSLGPIFAKIERRRAATIPRDTDFDAAS